MENLICYLNETKIPYILNEHPAVFTCEEADLHCQHVPGQKTKNLFIRDKKGNRHAIVTIPSDKNINLKELGKIIDFKGVSFGSQERLSKYLNLIPGSVGLLGIINDKEKLVEVYIDEDLWDKSGEDAYIQSHPLINTATISIHKNDLIQFFENLDIYYKVISIPEKFRED